MPHMFPGLFWTASLEKIPHVREVPRPGILSADESYTGCMGYSHACVGYDGVHALLDMG